VYPVGQLERRRHQVDQVRGEHDEGRNLTGYRGPPDAADGNADPDDRHGVDAQNGRTNESVTGRPRRRTAVPSARPTANMTVITYDCENRGDSAGHHPARPRASGVARSISRRPSSRRRPTSTRKWRLRNRPRSGAAGRTAGASRRPRRGRSPWKIRRRSRGSGSLSDLIWLAMVPTSDPISAPMRPSPIPQESARGSSSPNARLVEPCTPSMNLGRPGRTDPT
jgi:hypothetical protein